MATRTMGAITSAAAATGAAYAMIGTGSTRTFFVREVSISAQSATLSQVGLYRPANTPTGTSGKLFVAGDANDATPTVNLYASFGTAPTISTNVPLKQWTIGAVQGSGIIWTFDPEELVIPVSSFLVFWNYGAATASALDISVRGEER